MSQQQSSSTHEQLLNDPPSPLEDIFPNIIKKKLKIMTHFKRKLKIVKHHKSKMNDTNLRRDDSYKELLPKMFSNSMDKELPLVHTRSPLSPDSTKDQETTLSTPQVPQERNLQTAIVGKTNSLPNMPKLVHVPQNLILVNYFKLFCTLPSKATNLDILDDGEGFVKKKKLKVKEVWTLPLDEQIIVPFDNSGTPFTEVAGLFTGTLARLAQESSSVPINFTYWRLMPK
nr:uncharacterized protein LOC109149981 [Ipomoea batatas]